MTASTTIPEKPYRRHPQYVICGMCNQATRIEFTSPSMFKGMLSYCPVCGSDKLNDVSFNSDLDYWYILAEGFGLPRTVASANLIKGLFDMWDGRTHRLFRDFVEDKAGEVIRKIQAQNEAKEHITTQNTH